MSKKQMSDNNKTAFFNERAVFFLFLVSVFIGSLELTILIGGTMMQMSESLIASITGGLIAGGFSVLAVLLTHQYYSLQQSKANKAIVDNL